MKLHVKQSRAAVLLDACYAMHRPTDSLTITTDARSYPDKVLIAIWRPAAAFVMAIDASEYDGLMLARLCGFADLVMPTAMERSIKLKATHAKH